MGQDGWNRLKQDLLSAAGSGAGPALREFYDEHFPGVYRYVLCRVDGSHAEAEEIVQDVFYQAFRDFAQYDASRPPGAWLRGIARHRVLDFYRRTKRRPVLEVAFSRFDEDFARRLFDLETGELPDREIERTELAGMVELVLSDLPNDYETVLRLRYLDEKSVNEIARALNTTPKAAEARLYRARTAFRDGFTLIGRNLHYKGTVS